MIKNKEELMEKVFLVINSTERWRKHNKFSSVYAVCSDRETAIKQANELITTSRQSADVLNSNENGFEYIDRELKEADLFSSREHLGFATYYGDVVYHQILFEDGHRKTVWSVHIEEWDCLDKNYKY